MTFPPICLDCQGVILGQVVVVVRGDTASGTRSHGYAHPAGAPECLPGGGGRRRWTAAIPQAREGGPSRAAARAGRKP